MPIWTAPSRPHRRGAPSCRPGRSARRTRTPSWCRTRSSQTSARASWNAPLGRRSETRRGPRDGDRAAGQPAAVRRRPRRRPRGTTRGRHAAHGWRRQHARRALRDPGRLRGRRPGVAARARGGVRAGRLAVALLPAHGRARSRQRRRLRTLGRHLHVLPRFGRSLRPQRRRRRDPRQLEDDRGRGVPALRRHQGLGWGRRAGAGGLTEFYASTTTVYVDP